MKTLLATAGTCALLATAMTNAADMKPAADPVSPLLAPWDGPYGGVPPFDKVKVVDLKPATRSRHGAAARRNRADRERPGRADVREHHRSDGAHRPHARPRRSTSTASTARTHELTTPVPGGRDARWRRSSPRSRPDHAEPETVRAHRQAVYETRETSGLTPGAAAAGLGVLHELRARRRQAGRGGKKRIGGDQPASSPSCSRTSPERARRTKTTA